MAKDIRLVRRAFNAGEISKLAKYRNDTEKHAYSCENLENFYVSPLGGISRREGTRLLGVLGSVENADNVRLVPFEYNRSFSFILAFHTAKAEAGEDSNWTYSGEDFDLAAPFSVCFEMPENFKKVTTINGIKISTATYVQEEFSSGKNLYFSITTENPHGLLRGSKVVFHGFTAALQYANWGAGYENYFIKSDIEYNVDRVVNGYTFYIKAATIGKLSFVGNFSASGVGSGYVSSDSVTSDNSSFVQLEEATILSKGSFTLSFDSETKRLKVRDASITESAAAIDANAHKITLVYADGQTAIYDGKEKILSTSNLVYRDDGKGVVFYGAMTMGDMWGLKFLNFDITRSGAYYTIDDFIAGKDETDMIVKTPSYTGYESKYGASLAYVDGILTLASDWETAHGIARQQEDEKIAGRYADAAGNIAALKNSIESAEDEEAAGDFQSQLKALYANIYGFSTWQDFISASGEAESTLYDGCLTETYKLPITQIFEEVRVPFDARAGAQFHCTNELSPNGLEVVLEGNSGAEFEIGTSTSEDAQMLLFRFEIPKGGTAEFSGEFFLDAYFLSLLQTVSSSWDSDKVVMLSAYDINGREVFGRARTPIPAGILHEFQYKQVNGYLYIAHSSISPKRIEVGKDLFECLEAVRFQPSLDSPEEGLVLTFGTESRKQHIVYTGATGAIQSNVDWFDSSMVGTQLKIEYTDEGESTYKWKYNCTGAASTWFAPMGEITIRPEGGIWDGVLVMEESIDGGKSWNEIGRTTSVQGSSNTELTREVFNVNSLVRARMKSQNKVEGNDSNKVYDDTEGCFFNISTKAKCAAFVEITAVNGARNATVKFLNPSRAYFVSSSVYKSAWSPAFGWPRCVDVHEERLTLAGTIRQPSTVWLSQTNNWDNFRSVSNLDTDPLAYTLASDDGEPISWLVSRSDLMIGLGSSEWSLGSRDAGQALTQSIVKASDQSNDGVEYIMPAKVGNMVFYVRRGNREIGSITYDFASDAYNSISLTTMNPEILGPGAVNIFNQLSPRNNVYVVRKDGIVAVFTYDKENNVAAWSRMTFGDGVVSACALSTGGFKSVFLAVKRGDFLCLERLDPNEMGTGNWLDCAPFDADMEIPEGLEVSVPYVSTLKTTPLFLEGHVKVFQARFYMLESWGGECRLVGLDENGDAKCDDWEKIRPRERELFKAPVPRDYIYTKDCDAGFLEEGALEVRTDAPAPFVLCAIGLNARGG